MKSIAVVMLIFILVFLEIIQRQIEDRKEAVQTLEHEEILIASFTVALYTPAD